MMQFITLIMVRRRCSMVWMSQRAEFSLPWMYSRVFASPWLHSAFFLSLAALALSVSANISPIFRSASSA